MRNLGLFLISLKPFKKRVIYYSFYIVSLGLLGLFMMFGGVFLAIVSSLALYPIYTKETKYQTETIKIYDRFQGFMGRCCTYEVVVPKRYLFEKHLGYIYIDKPINDKKDEFRLKNNSIIYKYELERIGPSENTRDSTEILYFE